ncbi:MAG: PP2C family protein-serine/threonine phosphatase [Actinomycetes bacterium]
MALALRYAARSHVGLVRDGNEDSGYAGPRLLAVADGMGGAAAGEVASSVTIAALSALDEDSPGPDLLDRLTTTVDAANERLHELIETDPSLTGMGTTLTALLRSSGRVGLVHIGDSRGYLLRDGELVQLTHDHTFVQSLVDAGRITAEEAGQHPQRSLLMRALDGRGTVELDLSIREAREGDRYLVCTDGLTVVVSEETLADTLRQHADPGQAADELVELALRGGAPDNVTVVVADLVDVGTAPPESPEVVGAASAAADTPTIRVDGPRDSSAMRAARLGRAPAGTVDIPVDPRPRTHHRPRRWPRRVAVLVVVVLVLAGATIAGLRWIGEQYYVGAHRGQVTVFQGVPTGLGPVHLSRAFLVEDVPVSALPVYERQRVESTIPATNLPDALQIVARLRAELASTTPGSSP